MILHKGASLVVLYKCPYCCKANKQIKAEFKSTKSQFIDAMVKGGGTLIDCHNCGREITFVSDSGINSMLLVDSLSQKKNKKDFLSLLFSKWKK